VSAERCVEVPEGLPSHEVAFFNLLTIAMQGIRKARIELGEAAVVLGAGLIGQCAMQLARLSGATPVVALDFDEGRRALAQSVSADVALDPRGDSFESALRSALGPARTSEHAMPEVVIEATGYPDAIQTAFKVAGWMARVVLLGSTRGNTNDVNFYRDVHKKGLVLIGAHASTIPGVDSYPGHWTWKANVRTALHLIANGRLNVGALITHRLPAEDAPMIYGQIAEWKPNVLGAILEW
jgi:threonine dehydrogenase-like Zn-dependent dehydrogenase